MIIDNIVGFYNADLASHIRHICLGYSNIFRGFVVKKQFVDQSIEWLCKNCNEIIIESTIDCHNKAQKHRNKEFRNDAK